MTTGNTPADYFEALDYNVGQCEDSVGDQGGLQVFVHFRKHTKITQLAQSGGS